MNEWAQAPNLVLMTWMVFGAGAGRMMPYLSGEEEEELDTSTADSAKDGEPSKPVGDDAQVWREISGTGNQKTGRILSVAF